MSNNLKMKLVPCFALPLMVVLLLIGALMAILIMDSVEKPDSSPTLPVPQLQAEQDLPTGTATETIPPFTPLPSLTPSQTLKPPPTLEPPTHTPPPSLTPSMTPTTSSSVSVSLSGFHGMATPVTLATVGSVSVPVTPDASASSGTSSDTPCTIHDDWKGIYVVQPNDALADIATLYGLTMFDLAAGNCLEDMNLIVVGQEIRVPGGSGASSVQMAGSSGAGSGATTGSSGSAPVYSVSCETREALIPVNNTYNVTGDGNVTFEWRGPEAFRYLLRVIGPDGSVFEKVFDLRQTETIDAADIPLAGTYTWYVYPLNEDFQQINCPEGGPWIFTKPGAATTTPETLSPAFTTSAQGGPAPLEVYFLNQSQGDITDIQWTFGDGSTQWRGTPETAGYISHTYTVPGTYLITLWVKGPAGEATTSKFITIN